jgi:signal peptidase II
MSEASDKDDQDGRPDGEAGDAPPAGEAEPGEKDAAGKADGAGEAPAEKAEGTGDEAEGDDVVAAPAASAIGPRPSYAFLVVVTLITLAADLGTKFWAERRFENARGAARQMEVVKDLLIFRLAKNKGGAWGILSGESPALRVSFFIAISIVAVIFILTLYRKTTRDQKALTWGLPLVLGGALGNLVDRIRYGEVVDFIEVHLGSYQHPTFNIADIAIVAGVALMAIDMFTPRRRKGGTTAPAPESAKASS